MKGPVAERVNPPEPHMARPSLRNKSLRGAAAWEKQLRIADLPMRLSGCDVRLRLVDKTDQPASTCP